MPEQLLMIASIEAPFALIEKQVKFPWLDAVETERVALCLVPEVLDSIDVIETDGEEPTMADATMVKRAGVKSVVGL